MLTRKDTQEAKQKRESGYPEQRPNILAWLALKAIRFYKRFLSPLLPSACRFTPTCSEYMYEAISVHGLLRGLRLGLWRIWRCQPMYPGGMDPVPPRESRV